MIAILILLAIFLSFFYSLALNKQYAAVLLILMASGNMSPPMYGVIVVLFIAVTLQFLFAFLKTKQNKSFLWILLLPITYILAIFLIQPYVINVYNYLGYLTALLFFAWVTLLKWDVRKIVYFLTAYGSYLILSGFLEKIITGKERIGLVLTVATAYAVVLVITWTIWTVCAFLSKIYSVKTILFGTFMVFLAIIISGTRMGLIGIFLGLGLCGLSVVFIKNKNINLLKVAFYSTCVMALSLLFSFIIWNLLPNDLRIKKAFSSLMAGKMDLENMGRVVIWASSIDIIEKNKFLGIGAGNFHKKLKAFLESTNLYSVAGYSHGINTHSHNIYLMVLTEHGVIGFIVLSIFVFLCLLQPFLYFLKERREGRQRPEFFALLSGFIVMAVLGATDSMGMLLPTTGFAAWLLGTCASFKREREIC